MKSNKINTIAEEVDAKEKYVADLDQALAVAGLGWYNIKYSLVLALFLMAAIIEPVGYSFVLPAAMCDLDMTDGQRGFIASIPYIGIVTTSFPWGYLVDTRGRKIVVIYASLLAGLFGIASSFMPELISFATCKFLTALCIACPAAVPYTFIGEILPVQSRDMILSIVNALQISGTALTSLFAWAILPLDFRIDFGLYMFRSWRLLSIINASFFLIAAGLLSFGPESPKYLVSQGKMDEALKVLQGIYAGNKKKAPEDYPIKALDVPPHDDTKIGFLTSLKVQSLPLIKPPYVKWFALNGFLLFGIFSVLNGLYLWVPDVLNRVLSGAGEDMTACDVIRARFDQNVEENTECIDTIETITFVISSVANISCALIAVAVSSTVKFIGKKRLTIIVFFLIGTFCILINFITQDMVFAVLMSSFPILALAVGPVNAYSVEFFPTHLRGMAVGLTMMIGRMGSIVGTNVAGLLLNAICEMTFYLFGGLLIFCGLLAFLLPGTRRSPPIETTRL
ncbi:hypothetical protein PYW07_002115 [Mythimna separata]|uniref:Major facilitator superfamily (MFS) profile domain-containing protein n=1 Tax=Mythimna separata TaxID=271217 RepID=A0AAD7YNY1_MYTSE|nr:hypothetical protein PYW07_002115 [Mythimna separata]